MLLSSAKLNSVLHSKIPRLVILLIVLLVPACLFSIAAGQRVNGRVIVFPVTIKWEKRRAVTRYRLQIAADEKFQNVFFDRRVEGNRYTVNDLEPGPYYWRVAASDAQLGQFSRPVPFFLSGGVVTSVQLPRRTASSH